MMQDGRIREQFDVDRFGMYMEVKNDEIQVTDTPNALSYFTKMIGYLLTSDGGFAMNKEDIGSSKKTAKEVFDILKSPLAEAVQQYPTKEHIEPEIEGLKNLLKFMFTKAPNPDFSVLSRTEAQSFAKQVGVTLDQQSTTPDDEKASFYRKLQKIQR